MNTSDPCGFGPKPDRKQKEARLVVVEVMRFQYLRSNRQIETDLAKQWGVSNRTIRTYLQIVKERMAAQGAADPNRLSRDALTEAMLAQYQQIVSLAETATAKNELTTALRGRREAVKTLSILGEFHGLKVQRHEITGADGAPLSMSAEEAADAMLKVINEISGRGAPQPPAATDTPPAESGEPTTESP